MEFQDHTERTRPRRLSAFTDHAASDELGRKIARLVAFRAVGETPDLELAQWLEKTPKRIREKLGEWGLIDLHRVTGAKPLPDHIEDFKQSLLARGRTEKHANLLKGRMERIIQGCGFTFWSDINGNKVERYLAGLREDTESSRGISAQTFNFYCQAIKQFARWMVQESRAIQSPVEHLKGLNVQADRRYVRRAFEVNEMVWLLQVTEAEPDRFGMTGSERAMLYRLTVETAARAGEARSMRRSSFDLDDDPPVVALMAADTKNGRAAVLELRPETAMALKPFLAHKAPAAPAFNVPPSYDTAAMIQGDMATA